MKLDIKSLNYSTILTIFLIVVLTILGELSNSFKTFLTSITGHHWVTKGVFALIFFMAMYSISSRISKKDETDVHSQTIYTGMVAMLGWLIILGFYVWHFVF